MIPGEEIVIDRELVIDLLRSRRNPKSLPPLELIQQARRVDLEVFDSGFFREETVYYLLYEHPVLKRRDRLYLVRIEELLPFLRSRIKPGRGEGLDLTMTTRDKMEDFLICNHDGDMFLLSTTSSESGADSARTTGPLDALLG
ncbi:hypothetical protein P12x_003185 [Tundrisphaera lichenicola]|uniref:hypothetical protein n=1 Tax=Tundrisphaera lichenicola TaxID=2029860 RepID=UPI003EB731F7